MDAVFRNGAVPPLEVRSSERRRPEKAANVVDIANTTLKMLEYSPRPPLRNTIEG